MSGACRSLADEGAAARERRPGVRVEHPGDLAVSLLVAQPVSGPWCVARPGSAAVNRPGMRDIARSHASFFGRLIRRGP